MLPTQISEQDALGITDPVSDEQMQKSLIYGSPSEVASQLKDFVDAGCNFFSLWDILGFVLESDEGLAPMGTSVETARLLKERLAELSALQGARITNG